MQKSRSKQITQAITVNVARLDNKQMNENNVESKEGWTNLRITIYEKWENKKT